MTENQTFPQSQEEVITSSTVVNTPKKVVMPGMRLWLSIIVSGVLAVLAFVLLMTGALEDEGFTWGNFGICFGAAIFVFTFVSGLFFEESAVREVMLFMATRSLSFPGLIWEFSIDGFLWLIGMKILFAIIGFLAGVACAILGVIVAFIIAPFAYPFSLFGYLKECTVEVK